MKTKKIAVLSGDGIGPEVMKEAIKILNKVSKIYKLNFQYKYADVGGVAYDKYKTALPKKTLEICEDSDAILFGSVGGPKWENLPKEEKIERNSILALRKHFDFFANLRPAVLYPELSNCSPLKHDIAKDGFDMSEIANYIVKLLRFPSMLKNTPRALARGSVFDIMIIRELSGDAYFGKSTLNNEWAVDEMKYTKKQCLRIAKFAFEIAMKRTKHLTCVDKSNVLSSSIFFRKIVTEISKKYPSVKLDYMYIDNATMQLIKRPQDFDVIVTTNIFGDILSDEAAMITGSIGMIPSASINEKGFGLYEPAGGTAPDIAGKGIANPIAQILSAALMLRYSFNFEEGAKSIENAVRKTLQQGFRTKDIMEKSMKEVGTKEMGDLIAERI